MENRLEETKSGGREIDLLAGLGAIQVKTDDYLNESNGSRIGKSGENSKYILDIEPVAACC